MRDYDFIRNLFERLALAEDEERNGLYSRYLATQILLELRSQEREYRRTQGLLSSNEKLRLEIEEYAARRGYGNIRVSEIARALGYAEKYLSCVYKKTAGVPLKTFLKQKRAEQAKRLLRSTDYSVTEIAYFLNFDNPHNFCRFFKEITGVTPGEFRLSYNSCSNLSNSTVQPSTTSE